ncbi:MAG: DUF6492 family protein [Reyranellaceae bacterium]
MAEFLPRTTLQAILPLSIAGGRAGDDLARAVTQGRTLRHFFRRDQLLCVNVMAPPADLAPIADRLKPLETPWLQYRIADENMVDPGLTRSPVDGWYKQQLIKMSAPEWLPAPYWLTLDADVICTKPFGVEDLLPDGRALLDVDDVSEIPIYQRWAWAAREILGMAMPPLSISATITPLLYAAPVMRACHATIESLHGRPWKRVLLDPALVADQVRRFRYSWTENQLYHAVAVRSGLLRQHHALHHIDTPQKLIAGGVWRNEDWPDWNPAPLFDRAKPGFFAVCSSYTGMPAALVADKVEPFLAAAPSEAGPGRFAARLFDDEVEQRLVAADFRGRILARQPLVVLGPYDESSDESGDDWGDGRGNILQRDVLAPFRDEPAVVIVTLPSLKESVGPCKLIAARIARRQREAPQHRFIVFANTEHEAELLRQLGLDTALVSHNALIDERPFLADSPQPPEFDAVYNAGFHPIKRHGLAAEIESLALIAAPWSDRPQFADHAAQVRRALAHAVDLNRCGPDGAHRVLERDEIGALLQRARVGLCLSELEGSMRASVEYLFAGLPVVSTFARGGRDQLFDGDFCAIVPPSPALVAQAVRALADRNIPRRHIRTRTLNKVAPHRERFMQLVLQAVAATGVSGRPDIVWPWLDEERRFSVAQFHQAVRAGRK